jgi:hypothetical protein
MLKAEDHHVSSGAKIRVVTECPDERAAGGHNQVGDVEHLIANESDRK